MISGIPKNTVFYGSTLTDLLEYLKDDLLLELNCHAIGTIESFNPVLQTATASINYQKVVYQDTGNGVWGPVLFSYPVLVDCPVVYPFGGNGGLTVPYSEGDEVFIGFNDRDMDFWFTGRLNQGPNTARFHSFTDAVIIGGISSTPQVIQSFDASRPALRNLDGSSYVAVGDVKIEIAGNGTTLNTLLQQLLTEIQNITVGPGTFSNSGGPVVGASGTPLNAAAIASTATAIGELLE